MWLLLAALEDARYRELSGSTMVLLVAIILFTGSVLPTNATAGSIIIGSILLVAGIAYTHFTKQKHLGLADIIFIAGWFIFFPKIILLTILFAVVLMVYFKQKVIEEQGYKGGIPLFPVLLITYLIGLATVYSLNI